MIRWGSSSFRPSNGQGQGINPSKRQNILSPLEDRIPQGLVWGSQIVNVQKGEGVSPEPPFNPMSISGLQVWLDADDESTLNTYTSGSEVIVSGWTSKGNWTGTLTAETETRAPRFITNGGEGSSKAVYLYSGTSSSQNSGLIYRNGGETFMIEDGFTYFAFVKTNQEFSPDVAWDVVSSMRFGYFTGNTSTTFGQGTIQASLAQVTVNNQTGNTTGYAFSSLDSGGERSYSSISRYFLPNFSYDAQVSNINGMGENLIGNQPTSNSPNWRFDSPILPRQINQVLLNVNWGSSPFYSSSFNRGQEYYEVLLYNRQLSESEQEQVRTYLKNKWDYSVTIPVEYVPMTISWDASEITGNTTFSSQYFRVTDITGTPATASRLVDDLTDNLYYNRTGDNSIGFDFFGTPPSGPLPIFANYYVYGNGVLEDAYINASGDTNTNKPLKDYTQPVSVSGFTSYDLQPTTWYINYTGTASTAQFNVYEGNDNTGTLVYSGGGINVVSSAITLNYPIGSTFYVEYSDSEVKGSVATAIYVDDCIEDNFRENLTSGSGDNYNYLLTNLNPYYCVQIDCIGTP